MSEKKHRMNDEVKWFDEKKRIVGTVPYYISIFLNENVQKIKNKEVIKFDDWIKFLEEKQIYLSLRELEKPNCHTFEKYRRLWFFNNFNISYRKYYDIPYENLAYSDLNGIYFEKFKDFLNIYLKILNLDNDNEIKERIIKHYTDVIQNISYRDIPYRSRNPKYFAAALLFLILHSNLTINQTNLAKKLNSNKDLKLNLTNMSILIKFLYKIYFKNKKITDYKPITQDNVIDQVNYRNQLISYLDKEIEDLKLQSHNIRENCICFYDQARKNGFNVNNFKVKHPKYLAATLIFLSMISIENNNLTQTNIVDKLDNLKLNPTRFSNTINLFQKFLDKIIFFPFQHSNSDIFERKIQEILKKYPNYLEGNLILSLFRLSELNPNEFAKKLKIYNFNNESLNAAIILDILKKTTKFVQRDKFNNIIERFNNFIENSIPNESKSKAKKILNDYIQKRLLKKFDSLRRAKQKKNLMELLYGENFRSIEKRFNNFFDMRGFSPYDGTDLIELLELGETLGYHHNDYNPENDDTKNHFFLPKKVIENRDYISHNMISGLQANLARWNYYPNTIKDINKRLKWLYQLGITNSNIIRNAVMTKNIEFLDTLRNWSNESIKKAKIRILDEDFKSIVWKYKSILSIREHKYKDFENFY